MGSSTSSWRELQTPVCFEEWNGLLITRLLGYSLVANIPAAVFVILNLNPVMQLIFNSPAAIASTVHFLLSSFFFPFQCSELIAPQIVASRAVRRLAKYTDDTNVNI